MVLDQIHWLFKSANQWGVRMFGVTPSPWLPLQGVEKAAKRCCQLHCGHQRDMAMVLTCIDSHLGSFFFLGKVC